MSIKLTLVLNGQPFSMECQSVIEAHEIMERVAGGTKKEVAVKEKVAVTADSEIKTKKRKGRISPSFYDQLTETQILSAVNVARLQGKDVRGVAPKMAAAITSVAPAGSKNGNHYAFSYRLFQFMKTGKDYGISKQVRDVLTKNGVLRGELTAGFLGAASEYTRQLEVRQA